MSYTSTVSTFAVEEYNRRADFARAAVRKGNWSQQDAYRKLAPWLAMAVHPRINADIDALNLLGADRETLHTAIADLRVRAKDGRELVTIGQARWHISDGICPRKGWVPELTKARNAAQAAIKPGNEASQAQAAGLIGMVAMIGTDPNGRHSVPPYVAREPLQEAA